MSPDVVNDIADYIVLTAIPPVLLFIFYYLRARVEPSFIRTMLLLMQLSLLVILLINAASLFLGLEYWGRPIFRIIGYTLLSSSVWFQLYTLRRVQKSSPPVRKTMGSGLRPKSDIEENTTPRNLRPLFKNGTRIR